MSDLSSQVLHIRDQLECKNTDWEQDIDLDGRESASAWDYLEDILDIEYIISSSGEYLGARVLVTFGGPNIWINTRTNTIEGYWWSDEYHTGYKDELGIDEVLEEMYACTKVA